MTVSVDLFNPDSHYKVVCEWWAAQEWPAVPLRQLPALGLVVSIDGVLAAACWVYKTDSALCWLEWVVANPSVRHDARTAALSALLSSAKLSAKLIGFETMFTSVRHPSLSRRLESSGFYATERAMTNFVCQLQGEK